MPDRKPDVRQEVIEAMARAIAKADGYRGDPLDHSDLGEAALDALKALPPATRLALAGALGIEPGFEAHLNDRWVRQVGLTEVTYTTSDGDRYPLRAVLTMTGGE